MRILITGGLGYIGGRVANYLIENETDVEIVLGTSRKAAFMPEWSNACEVVRFALDDPETISTALQGVDSVIHLASPNITDAVNTPEQAWKIKTLGTYELLKQCKEKRVRRFINFSTFHVYGPQTSVPITENSPTRAAHPYAATHRAAEDIVQYFRTYHQMQTVTFRLSNGFGRPMDSAISRWSLLFNDLCRQATQNGKLVLKSSGRQQRDFVALSDVARAVHHFLFNIPDNWGDGLYNLGGECSLSVLEAAKRVARIYESKFGTTLGDIKTKPSSNSEDEPPVEFSIDKLKSMQFSLTGNMDEEIENTLKLCKDSIFK
ncbi:MAG: SDR family oxidoreductase [Candidatus Nitrohelix vancouverensis]|uniref:SDR family oxidoreductase n=1 Tax=Candidatus Nitrohelix vancouverensis TaxID=2705534 RepID=A0A7T0C040_9BACT|nr:MAG: SDR family oxidoreductase [Candidatus Nitrohelix vancouverensis]